MTRVNARARMISIVLISGTDSRHTPRHSTAQELGGGRRAGICMLMNSKSWNAAVPWNLESGAAESRNGG